MGHRGGWGKSLGGWLLATGLGLVGCAALTACAAMTGDPYQAALQAPPPTPRPPGGALADQRALAPYERIQPPRASGVANENAANGG